MAHPIDLIEIAYEHLSKVSDVKEVILCYKLYGKWLDSKSEVDFLDACLTKLNTFYDEKKKGD